MVGKNPLNHPAPALSRVGFSKINRTFQPNRRRGAGFLKSSAKTIRKYLLPPSSGKSNAILGGEKISPNLHIYALPFSIGKEKKTPHPSIPVSRSRNHATVLSESSVKCHSKHHHLPVEKVLESSLLSNLQGGDLEISLFLEKMSFVLN